MVKVKSYRSTIFACYLGSITMSVMTNFLPLLFVTLHDAYDISFGRLGLLVFINFSTQVIFDFAFSSLIDKYGFRRFVVSSSLLTVLGFTLFACAPWLTDNPYPVFVVATVIYSGSCGLLELILSPIVNSVPTDEKKKAVTLLHSFYCWGVVLTILLTTACIAVFGKENWQLIMLGWVVLPIIDFFMFLKVPLEQPTAGGGYESFRMIKNKSVFFLLCLAILFGAGAELGMAQWASTFIEKALNINKTVGDIAGTCMFAVSMGIARVIFGKYGAKINTAKALTGCFAFAFACYMVAVFSSNGIVGLVACALTGFGVSILWPGSLIAATECYPMAGAWIFAVLAGFGDIGGSASPWLIGKLIDRLQTTELLNRLSESTAISTEQLGLKAGLLFGAIFPLMGVAVCALLSAKNKRGDLSL